MAIFIKMFSKVQINEGFKYEGIFYIKISDNEAMTSLYHEKKAFLGSEYVSVGA